MRDKLNNLVLFDKATYDKLYKEVPNYKLITPAVVSERLKIRGSLARNALQELLAKGELNFLIGSAIKTQSSDSDEPLVLDCHTPMACHPSLNLYLHLKVHTPEFYSCSSSPCLDDVGWH